MLRNLCCLGLIIVLAAGMGCATTGSGTSNVASLDQDQDAQASETSSAGENAKKIGKTALCVLGVILLAPTPKGINSSGSSYRNPQKDFSWIGGRR
jgi:hypothetical protein